MASRRLLGLSAGVLFCALMFLASVPTSNADTSGKFRKYTYANLSTVSKCMNQATSFCP